MKRYFESIKQYCWILFVCLVLAIMGGFYISKALPVASTVNTIFVVTQYYTVSGGTSTATADLLTLATNYAGEVPTRAVMDYVFQQYPDIANRRYTADDLIADVVAAPSTTTPTVILTATAAKPGDAVLLANSVADGFSSYIQSQLQGGIDTVRKQLQTQFATYQTDNNNLVKQILGYPTNDPHIALLTAQRSNDLASMSSIQKQLDALPATAPNNVQVVQHAKPSDVSTSSKSSLIIVSTSGIGLVLGFLVMLLVIFLDKRLRSEEQVKEKLGLAYIGSVSSNGDLKSSPTRPSGSVAHELGDVIANLRLTGVMTGTWQAPNGAALLITSPQSAEGKTTLAAGLAAMAARGGQAVVVVDGNLNHPSTHLTFGMSPSGIGLNGLLKGTGREMVDDAVVRSNVPGVWLLPVGTSVEASALQLEQKMPSILAQLRKKTDLVIIDGPSLLSGADASVLATMVDGVALVVDARHDKLPLLMRAKEVLNTLTTTPVGIVLNRKSGRSKNRYFATAVPARTETQKWAPATSFEVKGNGNGNGHSYDGGNGQYVEPVALAALTPVKATPPPSMPPSPVPGRSPYQQMDVLPPSPVPDRPSYQQKDMPTMLVNPLSPRPGSGPWQSKTPPPIHSGKDE